MSFPGYLKSLNLVHKREDDSKSASRAEEDGIYKTSTNSHASSITKLRNDNLTATESVGNEEAILDERGNPPTRSLWVGNIPSKTTSTEVRALFSRFGTIVSTRPQAKYAFVNFERIDSAIAAFHAYHDQDIFNTGNQTINIRFTGTLEEAKQAKDDFREHRSSTTTKAEAAQKQWFQPTDAAKFDSSPKLSDSVEWPNGKPPSGPKSQRKEISPPPLRRGDSYRPSELLRGDSYRSESDYRRVERDDHRRGRDHRKRSSQHYSPEYSSSNSRSPVRTSSSRASPRYQHRPDESPFPWERRRGEHQFRNLVWTKESADVDRDDKIAIAHEKPGHEYNFRSIQRQDLDTKSVKEEIEASCALRIHPGTPDEPEDGELCSAGCADDVCAPSVEAKGELTLLAPTVQTKQLSKSPSLRPIERIRIEDGSFRGSSVPSEIATSSSRASTKKKKCHDCKKAASELTPLLPCSICTRKFHSGCGDPRPSSCLDKSKYVCGRCRRKQETGSRLDSADAETRSQSKIGGKVHLVSPPLSLSHDGRGSTNLSPRDDFSNLLSDDHRFESFFPTRPDAVETTTKSVGRQDFQDMGDSTKADPATDSLIAHHSTPQSMTQDLSTTGVLVNKNKYKVVTCKWWTQGNCTQAEDGCYYAHQQTAISFPDRKRVNKSWTCYDWLHNRCPMTEQDCLHAHCDTGLYTWRDGRPSFKHVTCFWWSRGRCKWDDEACKMAHEDTGLYSTDPSEISLGGGKFSTVPPLITSSRLKQHRHGTGPYSSFHKDPETADASRSDPASQSESNNNRSNSIALTGTKPSLTIDTSTKTTVPETHLSFNNARPFPGTIGAPPQTPNEDSPDKSNSHVFDVPSTFRFPQIIPDLPTPANEEQLQLENQSRGLSYTSVASTPIMTAASKRRESQSAVQKNDSPLTGEVVRSSAKVPHQALNLDQFDGADLMQSPDTIKYGSTRDPRLLRSNRISEHTASPALNSDTSIPANLEALASCQEQTKLAVNPSPPTGDETSRQGVKKCRNCQKTVFRTDLCKTCSGRKHSSSTEIVLDQPSQPIATSPKIAETAKVSVTEDSILEKISSTAAAASVSSQTPLKHTLKRSISGSNMFLKNKRLKTSMACSFSGSIRPDAFRRGSTAKRSSVSLTNTDSRRETQTLEDLIQKEREKKRTETILDVSVVQSPSSESEEEIVDPRRLSDQSHNVTITSSTSTSDDQTTPRTSITESFVSTSNNLFSSPRQSPVREKPITSQSIFNSKLDLQPSDMKSPKERSMRHLSHGINQWRSSESPEPPAATTEPIATSKRASPPKASDSLSTELLKTKSATTESKKLMPSNRPFTRDIVVSPEKFSWASPITCTLCQKHHKKCLHDNDGSLSAVKCRDYVLARKGRPDTGRSRQEWNIIVETSELDPNSDDDSSEDEDLNAKPGEDLASDGSEEEYTTAVIGDEMSIDGNFDNEIDEGQALLDKFKQTPPIRTAQSSPKKRSLTSVTKFFPNNHIDGWTLAKEQAKKNELGKRGVMFEVESEDEDYLSDDLEPPQHAERPVDPLYVPPNISRDLFDVAPELDCSQSCQGHTLQNKPEPRPSRKEQWAQLQIRQLQARRELFGNPCWEVNRIREDIYVTALIERYVPPQNTEDKFAVGSVQTREERITFGDFLGIPKLPEVCLMGDGERLGFRDGQKERDRTFGRTGRGLCKGATDEEKWPVRMK